MTALDAARLRLAQGDRLYCERVKGVTQRYFDGPYMPVNAGMWDHLMREGRVCALGDSLFPGLGDSQVYRSPEILLLDALDEASRQIHNEPDRYLGLTHLQAFREAGIGLSDRKRVGLWTWADHLLGNVVVEFHYLKKPSQILHRLQRLASLNDVGGVYIVAPHNQGTYPAIAFRKPVRVNTWISR